MRRRVCSSPWKCQDTLVKGTGYVPVACCSARARLGCSWGDRRAQKDQEGKCRQVSHGRLTWQYIQKCYRLNNEAEVKQNIY